MQVFLIYLHLPVTPPSRPLPPQKCTCPFSKSFLSPETRLLNWMWQINFKCHLLKENPGIDFKTEKQRYSNSPLVSQDCSGTFSSSFSSIRDACSGPWPTTHKHRSFIYITACCCARQHYMLHTSTCIFWSRKGNTHITASGGLHILTPVCWSPAAPLHSQQPLHCLRTCSQLLDPPTTTAPQSGLIIWSHD